MRIELIMQIKPHVNESAFNSNNAEVLSSEKIMIIKIAMISMLDLKNSLTDIDEMMNLIDLLRLALKIIGAVVLFVAFTIVAVGAGEFLDQRFHHLIPVSSIDYLFAGLQFLFWTTAALVISYSNKKLHRWRVLLISASLFLMICVAVEFCAGGQVLSPVMVGMLIVAVVTGGWLGTHVGHDSRILAFEGESRY